MGVYHSPPDNLWAALGAERNWGLSAGTGLQRGAGWPI